MKITAITPRIKLGAIEENVLVIIDSVNKAQREGADLVALPLNVITGDFPFLNEDLIKNAINKVAKNIDICLTFAYKIDDCFKPIIIENKKVYYGQRKKLDNGLDIAVLDFNRINEKEIGENTDLAVFVCSYPYLIGAKKEIETKLTSLKYKNVALVSGNLGDNNYKFVRSIDKIIVSNGKILASSNLEKEVSCRLDFNNSPPPILKNYARKPSFSLNNDDECEEALDIIGRGLFYRLNEINSNKVILGLSGGLDSTFVLLASFLTFKKYGLDIKNIICVRMPTINSSDRTKNNASILCNELNVSDLEINIQSLLKQQLKAINHTKKDVVYENCQARIRSRILLDLGNKENALVLGTSDLTESALGFSTYGGDQLSHYNINKSLTKSAIKELINFIIRNKFFSEIVNQCLLDILNTPISPELKKNQKTEEILGKLFLHEYFLLRLLSYKEKNEEILNNAYDEFKNIDKREIKKYFNLFINRFYNNRFKTRFSADGVQLFSYDLTSLE